MRIEVRNLFDYVGRLRRLATLDRKSRRVELSIETPTFDSLLELFVSLGRKRLSGAAALLRNHRLGTFL
ncbi:MAG TPA: hypothetical protein VJP86_08035 [Vicinamibacterales bacterium]|nr:hypothetical protein [Vicinamibacterales bacterium]